MISPFPKWCSFLEKFERISKKIVNLLARPPAAASLLQRGAPRLLSLCEALRAGHPPRFRKSRLEQTKINSDFCPKKNAKILKNFLLNSNGHPGCTQTLSDLPKVAIKKSER
jgi:hypothetical protein